MLFTETTLAGAVVIDPERQEDQRGFFARSWCQEEFAAHGLPAKIAQCGISYNARKGTLRGMHYQHAPHAEGKLVRCTAGAVYDVIVDLRRQSPTFRQWIALELTAENRRMLYVPEGFAHGFETLTEHAEVFYQISEFYHPESAAGVRWDDPAFGIRWPCPPAVISPRDGQYEDFTA